jgi:hypothetical protein
MTEASASFANNLTDDPDVRYTEGGDRPGGVPGGGVGPEELGASLRWATATTTGATRSQGR